MKHDALAILKRITKPKSSESIQKFLLDRHGATSRENVSADISALDDRMRMSQPDPPQKK